MKFTHKELKTMVAWGNNNQTKTFCPSCQCEVKVKNALAKQYAKDGILCDECRSEKLANR